MRHAFTLCQGLARLDGRGLSPAPMLQLLGGDWNALAHRLEGKWGLDSQSPPTRSARNWI